MYINTDTIIYAASFFTACGVLLGIIIAIYKMVERDKRQSEAIKAMQAEQTVICYGLRGALQGLIEKGCDGPCKEALAMLDEHLNKTAHKPDL